MIGRRIIAPAVAFAGLVGLAGNAGAIPLPNSVSLDAIGANASRGSLVQKTHGCHRGWVRGWSAHWGRRLAHRHVGPYCRPVRPQRYYGPGRPYRWQHRGCFNIGPVWYCP